MAYYGSLRVGHCSADKLAEHFFTFMGKIDLDVKFMLHLGIDGPNANLKFQKLLLQSHLLAEEQTTFSGIIVCPLHVIHSAFRKDDSSLEFNVDQFALEIYFFFKLSAERRADYKSMVDITDPAAEYYLKNSTTRWVILRKVLLRLIQQYDNLKEHFLAFLPKRLHLKRM